MLKATFEEAILKIPKSGEVWCEGARIALSNHSCNKYYDINQATKYLEFAIQFTPQYGDSFLELLRASKLISASETTRIESRIRIKNLLRQAKQSCLHCEPNYGVMWFYFKNSLSDSAAEIWENADKQLSEEMKEFNPREICWLGCKRLIRVFSGQERPSISERMKIVYGFEQEQETENKKNKKKVDTYC